MKVGIISMQRINNYGSILQAYALKRLLEVRGHEVGFVDIPLKIGYVPHAETKLKRIINRMRKIDKYVIRRLADSKKNKLMERMFRNEQKKLLGLQNEQMSEDGYDAIVIGSDEIFNCSSISVWGINGKRFGDIPNVSEVVSYAASCGYTNSTDIMNNDDLLEIKNGLQKLTSISVRDKNTFHFVQKLSGRNPEINLDPVLIYDFKHEIDSVSPDCLPNFPYMVIYAYHNRIDSDDEIKAICEFSKANGLRTIAIGGALPWCDEFRVLSPFQVLCYFKNAEYIVTDTFHGTIFSVKMNKSFAVIVRENNANKLDDLILRLKVDKHKVNNMSELSGALSLNDNYEETNMIIKDEIQHTLEYFQKAGL